VMAALADRVPIKALAYLVFTRREWNGREAQAAGLVSWTTPAAELQAHAADVVATIAGCSSVALRACKQYLAHAPGMTAQAASAFAGHLAGTALSARY
ncbi:MAG: putative enoyl-coA hydratase/isomerase, partial [Ramlibacter sp.]|nr:putative enoyl-coA hydratase/isomerase [Ramlibacter sp.]